MDFGTTLKPLFVTPSAKRIKVENNTKNNTFILQFRCLSDLCYHYICLILCILLLLLIDFKDPLMEPQEHDVPHPQEALLPPLGLLEDQVLASTTSSPTEEEAARLLDHASGLGEAAVLCGLVVHVDI